MKTKHKNNALKFSFKKIYKIGMHISDGFLFL